MRRAGVTVFVWVATLALMGGPAAFAKVEEDEEALASEFEAPDAGDEERGEEGAEGASGLGDLGGSFGWLVPGTGASGSRGPTNVEHVDRRLVFRGADLWWKGAFSYAGALWSPDGLDREGFVMKSLIGAGSYRYRSGGTPITGYHALLSVMPGWRFKGDTFETSFFVGADVQAHALVPDDPNSRLRGVHAGPRIGWDVWLQPTQSFMFNGFATFSTVGLSYAVRGGLGWRQFDAVYIGPEGQITGSTDYRQFRVGLHATGLVVGPYEFSAGLGYVRDSDYRAGIYTRFGVVMRR